MNGAFVYAQFFTTIWCVLAYSSGMPILYPVACVNFTIIYWVYKILMVKYYRKTVSFNQDLPIYSIFYLKIGIVLHVCMALFVLSNEEIVSAKLFDNLEEAYGVDNSPDKDLSGGKAFTHRFTTGVGLMYLKFLAFIVFF